MGYYSHSLISQGYTQNGQIMGAGSGYFGNSQYIALRTYFSKGNVTLFLHYNRPDTNYIDNIGLDTKYDEWKDTYKGSHEQWGLYKSIRTCGINIQYFFTNKFLIDCEYNLSWIKFPMYKKDKVNLNNYVAFTLKYNF